MGNRAEARKSRARAGSTGCDRRTMRTDGSRAAASRAAIARMRREGFWSSKKGFRLLAVNECNLISRGEQCMWAGRGVVCVCVSLSLCV